MRLSSYFLPPTFCCLSFSKRPLQTGAGGRGQQTDFKHFYLRQFRLSAIKSFFFWICLNEMKYQIHEEKLALRLINLNGTFKQKLTLTTASCIGDNNKRRARSALRASQTIVAIFLFEKNKIITT